MNSFLPLLFSGLLSIHPTSQIFPAYQDQSRVVDSQQFNTIQRVEVKNRIERLIQSASTGDRAWAAYLIGEYKFKDFAPALIELLNPNSPGPDWETGFVYRAVLDGLIKLGVSAPSDSLTPLYNRFPDETLITMARSPSEHSEALLFIAEQPGREVCWVAACNLLAESKAPGFAAFLLKSLKIKVEIGVYDEEKRTGIVDGASSLCAGGGMFQVPDGFPPTALYQLTDAPRRDAVVVAPGAHPVFYVRQVVEPGIASGIGAYNSSVRTRPLLY